MGATHQRYAPVNGTSDAPAELTDGGHFLLESHGEDVVGIIGDFLDKRLRVER